jgi:hypothetical protein
MGLHHGGKPQIVNREVEFDNMTEPAAQALAARVTLDEVYTNQ